MRQITFVLIVFLLSSSLNAQKSVLIPPCLKLEFPDNNWELTSHNPSEALWLNNEKIIQRKDGNVEISVRCFYLENLPFLWTLDYFDDFLSGSYENDTLEFYSFQDYKGYFGFSKQKEETQLSAMHRSSDGCIIVIFGVFKNTTNDDAKLMFDQILLESQILSLKEMDQEYGYPLDPEADHSEFISTRKQNLVEFYGDYVRSKEVRKLIDKMPLEKMVPELYDGFTFERLFKTWNGLLSGAMDLDEYFNNLILKKSNEDIELYHKYADDHSGEFMEAELKILYKQLDVDLNNEAYFNSGGWGGNVYDGFNDSGDLTHSWRSYYKSRDSLFIVLCFHKEGQPLSSAGKFKIDLVGSPEFNAGEQGKYTFWSVRAELNNDDDQAEDEKVLTNLIGINVMNTENKETILVGSSRNRNTRFLPISEFNSIEHEIQYTIRNYNYLHGRVYRSWNGSVPNIYDSISYDYSLSSTLEEEFLEMTKMPRKKIVKEVDSLFVKSYDGRHSVESIEWDIEERPAYYAMNSKVFNLPPEKRAYSTEILHEDLNEDGRVDAYCFTVSNGEVVDAQIIYDTGNDVEKEENPEKYFVQFKNSEKGRLLIRISLQKKNLLPADLLRVARDEDY